MDVDYTCTFTTNPGSGKNTATAVWDDEFTIGDLAYRTISDTDSGTADYDFANATVNESNTAVWLDDPKAPPAAGLPVKVTTGDLPYQLTYPGSLPGVAGTCTDYPNTATIYSDQELTTPVDSDSETVTVCVAI